MGAPSAWKCAPLLSEETEEGAESEPVTERPLGNVESDELLCKARF